MSFSALCAFCLLWSSVGVAKFKHAVNALGTIYYTWLMNDSWWGFFCTYVALDVLRVIFITPVLFILVIKLYLISKTFIKKIWMKITSFYKLLQFVERRNGLYLNIAPIIIPANYELCWYFGNMAILHFAFSLTD